MGVAVAVDKKYTYADYLLWSNDERWEIIGGVAYDMTPAPMRIHQTVSTELSRQIANWLIDKPCAVYTAPFDVRFVGVNKRDESIDDVVQPDLVIVCDKNKLDAKGCLGSPDFFQNRFSVKAWWE